MKLEYFVKEFTKTKIILTIKWKYVTSVKYYLYIFTLELSFREKERREKIRHNI